MNSSRPSERGSALFIIFIMIAIFAALSYAVSSNVRVGSGTANVMNEEKIRLNTADLLSKIQSLNTAVQTMILNGCRPEQISYENPVVTGYTNSLAPSDKRCHVFDARGGGLRWLRPDGINDGSDFYYPNHTSIVGVDRSVPNTPDLGFFLPGLSREMCIAMNNALGVTNVGGQPPTDLGYSNGRKFQGTFYTYDNFGDDGGVANQNAIKGKKTACIRTTGFPAANIYVVYNVMYVR